MKETIDNIIAIEWEMFDKVQGTDGRALCQDDKITFDIMRGSQYESWPERLCESWYQDLLSAKEEGRNLMTEKYAYMMEYSSPEEFDSIRDLIPKLSEEKRILVRKVTNKNLTATAEVASKYPEIVSMGRKLHSSEDTKEDPSIETYFIGELSTYSIKTLSIYDAYLDELESENKNIAELSYRSQAKKYGFDSLEDWVSYIRSCK